MAEPTNLENANQSGGVSFDFKSTLQSPFFWLIAGGVVTWFLLRDKEKKAGAKQIRNVTPGYSE